MRPLSRWLIADMQQVVSLEKRARPHPPSFPSDVSLVAVLDAWKMELARSRLLAVARRWGVVALVLALLLASVGRPAFDLSLWIVVGFPCVLLVAGAALVLQQQPSRFDVARYLDRRLSLHEQVATALDVAGDGPAGSILGPHLVARATAAAREALYDWKPGRAPARGEWITAAVLSVALICAVIAPKVIARSAPHRPMGHVGQMSRGMQHSPLSTATKARLSVPMSVEVVSAPSISPPSRTRALQARPPALQGWRSGSAAHPPVTHGSSQAKAPSGAPSVRARGRGAHRAAVGRTPAHTMSKGFIIPGAGRRTPSSERAYSTTPGTERPGAPIAGAAQKRFTPARASTGTNTSSSRRGAIRTSAGHRQGHNLRTRPGVVAGRASLAGSSLSHGGRGAGSARAGTQSKVSRARLPPHPHGHLIALRSPYDTGGSSTSRRTASSSSGSKEQRIRARGSQGVGSGVDYIAPSPNLVVRSDRTTVSRYFTP